METKYKAVLLDIDGTLVPAGRAGVSRRVLAAVDAVRRQGVKIIVVTGRAGFVLTPALLGEFTADYYVCVNGSLAQDAAHRTLREARLTSAQVESLCRFAEAEQLVLAFSFEDNYYFYCGYEQFVHSTSHHYVGDGAADGWGTDCPSRDRHLKSMPYGAVLRMAPAGIRLPQDESLSFVKFAPGCYDIYRSDIDKARGTKQLLAELGIRLEDCVAIGDGNNDVPLLQAAGLGVAMGNARPAALAAADLVTAGVEEDGVADALERIFELQPMKV